MKDIAPDPTQIGDVAAPPFAVLPDIDALFARRAARLRDLAGRSPLGPFLSFLARVVDAQQAALADLPGSAPLAQERLRRAGAHGMPLIDAEAELRGGAFTVTLAALLARLDAIAAPAPAAQALRELGAADQEIQLAYARSVLAADIPLQATAACAFVGAALQLHLARLAATLPVASMNPVEGGLCPACGARPCVSLVAGWHGALNARFCVCSLCATLWNYVRIRCVACGSTQGIGYREIDDAGGAVKGECCAKCGAYLKILYQTIDPHVEAIADDVATSALDLLLREAGERRFGFNPFLIGY